MVGWSVCHNFLKAGCCTSMRRSEHLFIQVHNKENLADGQNDICLPEMGLVRNRLKSFSEMQNSHSGVFIADRVAHAAAVRKTSSFSYGQQPEQYKYSDQLCGDDDTNEYVPLIRRSSVKDMVKNIQSIAENKRTKNCIVQRSVSLNSERETSGDKTASPRYFHPHTRTRTNSEDSRLKNIEPRKLTSHFQDQRKPSFQSSSIAQNIESQISLRNRQSSKEETSCQSPVQHSSSSIFYVPLPFKASNDNLGQRKVSEMNLNGSHLHGSVTNNDKGKPIIGVTPKSKPALPPKPNYKVSSPPPKASKAPKPPRPPRAKTTKEKMNPRCTALGQQNKITNQLGGYENLSITVENLNAVSTATSVLPETTFTLNKSKHIVSTEEYATQPSPLTSVKLRR